MRRPTFCFFLTAVLCAGLFAGCEWTGSDGESSWSGSYDDMNFSGTYRIGVATDDSTGGDLGGVDTISVSEKVGTYSTGKASYSGKLHGGVVPASVTISAGGYSYSDNGNGVLVGNVAVAGNGTINYSSGAWSFTVLNWIAGTPSAGDITAVYSYTKDVAGGSTITTDEAVSLRTITIQQTGQNLTMIFSNGLTLTGKFTTVTESGGESGTTFNAGFEVSSPGNKFVGTLNNAGGRRVINGTWISGKTYFDVNGTAN